MPEDEGLRGISDEEYRRIVHATEPESNPNDPSLLDIDRQYRRMISKRAGGERPDRGWVQIHAEDRALRWFERIPLSLVMAVIVVFMVGGMMFFTLNAIESSIEELQSSPTTWNWNTTAPEPFQLFSSLIPLAMLLMIIAFVFGVMRDLFG